MYKCTTKEAKRLSLSLHAGDQLAVEVEGGKVILLSFPEVLLQKISNSDLYKIALDIKPNNDIFVLK